ncbi:MAG: C40 family peptidase [Bacilli bacterium]|nr:C40 family peptidase [Bacilli bacterium]
MKYVLLADMSCVGDLTTCCSDYGIAYYLFFVKKALDIIHIVVPILLILMVTIDLVKMVLSPDDPQKKKSKSLINKFMAAILVFFVPLIVNVLFGLIDGFGVDVGGCWKAAEQIVDVMESTEEYNADLGETKGEIKDNTHTTSSGYVKDDEASGNKKNDDEDPSTATGSDTGKKMVNYGKRFLGNPYVWGGNSLTNGVDCSGFTQQIHKKYGISIPRVAADQAASSSGKSISSLSKAKAGDLVFYRGSDGTIGHVAMYMGDGKVIHASNKKDGIKISEANYKTPASIKRFW